MANLTKEQVRNIIENAPAGTSPEGVVAALRSQGHVLEGFDEPGEQVSSDANSGLDNTLNKIGKGLDAVFGGGVIGEAIGTQIAKFRATPQERQFIEGPTGRQIAGDVLKTGTTLASAAIPGVGGIARGAAIGAGQAAALSSAEVLREDGTVADAAESILPGLTRGAAVGAILPGIPKGMSATARKLMGSSLRLTKNMEKLQLKGKLTDPSGVLLDRKILGSANRMLGQTRKQIDDIDTQVNQILRESGKLKRFNTEDLRKAFVSRLNSKTRGNLPKDEVEKLINTELKSLRKLQQAQVNALDMNEVKKFLSNVKVGTSKLHSDRAGVMSQQAQEAIADVLRANVKQQAPKVGRLLADERGLIDAQKFLIETMSSKPSMMQMLAQNGIIVGGIAGAAAGGGLAFPLAAAGLVGATRLASSPTLKTGSAAALNEASKAIDKLIKANPNLTREQIINLLNQ